MGSGAGTGLGAHTISAFSVMVGATSAWAWGGHMDPEGVLTCGREGSQWEEESDATHTPLAQQSPQMEGIVGGGRPRNYQNMEDLIQGQEMPTEMLCSDEPSSVVSELFVTHEGMSKFPSSRIPAPGVRREGQGR